MIKIIATDLDGTLLKDGANVVPDGFFETIKKCKEKGVIFVAASGRNYNNMRYLFEPVLSDIYFISDNGAAIIYRDEIIQQRPIPKELIREIYDHAASLENCGIFPSTATNIYVRSKPPEVAKRFREYSKDAILFDNIEEFIDEDIIRFATYSTDDDLQKNEAYFKNNWGEHLQVARSGAGWIDFSLSGKGAALRYIMDTYGIDRSQAAAFGDNYNDIQMLGTVDYSFAMMSADDVVKSHAKYQTDSVPNTIERFLDSGEIF